MRGIAIQGTGSYYFRDEVMRRYEWQWHRPGLSIGVGHGSAPGFWQAGGIHLFPEKWENSEITLFLRGMQPEFEQVEVDVTPKFIEEVLVPLVD